MHVIVRSALLLSAFALLLPTPGADAQGADAQSDAQPSSDGSSVQRSAAAPNAYVGVYLHDVTNFDQRNGVFDADFEMWVKWLGDFDPEQLIISNAASVERLFLGTQEDHG